MDSCLQQNFVYGNFFFFYIIVVSWGGGGISQHQKNKTLNTHFQVYSIDENTVSSTERSIAPSSAFEHTMNVPYSNLRFREFLTLMRC